MTLEKRLLYADALLTEVVKAQALEPNKAIAKTIMSITESEGVDAVEVVRCKDCKYAMKSRLQPRHVKNYLCRHSWEGEYHEADHFCSYGERKVNG